MQKIPAFIVLLLPLFFLFSSCEKKENKELTDYVNPFIGTGGHGHTYPGASAPFGMVQLSPDTRLSGWDGCSAYHYSDSIVYGFSHTHLSGTGISDYGDILLMPVTEAFNPDNWKKEYGYESPFSHGSEVAKPAYYSVELLRYKIKAELTATPRTGMHRYTFPENAARRVVLDLKHRDFVLASSIFLNGNNEISGERRSKAWAPDQRLYYVIRFSQNIDSVRLFKDNTPIASTDSLRGENLKAIIYFSASEKPLIAKVGISAVDIKGARKNMIAENPGWDFDRVYKKTRKAWEKELSKIKVSSDNEEQKRIFYTAVYHSYLNPNLYMDVDGRYRGTDGKVHTAKDFTNYTVFSLWDTFRATHPLFTIVQRKRTEDFIQTFLHQYQYGGQLPVWELSANYTGCMIGYHAVPVIVDAYVKGIRGFDAGLALKAMKHSATMHHLGLDAYREKGFIAIDDEPESVSKTLEYAYDDWCIAQMARQLRREKDYKTYIRRAQSYKNLYNPATGFMQPKKENIWKTPFDPREVDFNFTEANSWQYSFFVPQDVQGLIALHGGDSAFIARLDSLFAAPEETSGRHQSDITGLIGQYAHGNEPSHHMAYLYAFAGAPWNTQEMVTRILYEMYSDKADGLSGNEDCGQMSSWYVLSSIGFYPVTPGSKDYIFGTPLFPKTVIHLENGNEFTIEAPKVSDKNIYIQSAKLNGKNYDKSFISIDDILAGGKLYLKMGPKPNKAWASDTPSRPKSSIDDYPIQPVPYFVAATNTFFDSIKVELASPVKGAKIYYSTNGSRPDSNSLLYTAPIVLHNSGSISAIAYAPALPPSKVVESRFKKIPKTRSIKLLSTYSNQYTAGGDNGLIDFIKGGKDFRDGTWQGYEGQDFTAIVDLGKKERIRKISVGFMQSIRSWIWIPRKIHFYISDDGENFTEVGVLNPKVAPDDDHTFRHAYGVKLNRRYARYVKIHAESIGKVPDWHPGAGGKSWIFVDEIVIE